MPSDAMRPPPPSLFTARAATELRALRSSRQAARGLARWLCQADHVTVPEVWIRGDSERGSWRQGAWLRSSSARARGYEPCTAGVGSKCRPRRTWQRVSRDRTRATPWRCSAGRRAKRRHTDRRLERGFRAEPVPTPGACGVRVVWDASRASALRRCVARLKLRLVLMIYHKSAFL